VTEAQSARESVLRDEDRAVLCDELGEALARAPVPAT